MCKPNKIIFYENILRCSRNIFIDLVPIGGNPLYTILTEFILPLSSRKYAAPKMSDKQIYDLRAVSACLTLYGIDYCPTNNSFEAPFGASFSSTYLNPMVVFPTVSEI